MSKQTRCLISVLLHLIDFASCSVGLIYFGGSSPIWASFVAVIFCGASHLLCLTDPLCSPRPSTALLAIGALCYLGFVGTLWIGRPNNLFAWAMVGALMWSGRFIVKTLCQFRAKPIAIRGTGPRSRMVALAIQRQPYGTYRVKALLSNRTHSSSLPAPCFCNNTELPKNWLIIDPLSNSALQEFYSSHCDWKEGDWCLRAPEGPGDGVSARLKRLFDLAIAALAFIPVACVVLLVALLMILSGQRPLFYSQTRLTRGSKSFAILKLRTMPIDAEPHNQAVWPQRHDTRVTPAGRILRQLWLDELPQLWNVLKGDLSWVGPRPERPEFSQVFSKSIPKYPLRHRAMAGVTGLAQIRGFVGNTSLRKRLMCDLEYIRTWSPWLDLQVLARTVCQVFVRRRQPVFDFTPEDGERIP